MPNSAARLRLFGTGGASPSLASTRGRIKLTPRGGGALVRSGPDIEGFLLSLAGDIDRSPFGPVSLDGLRMRGSDGRLKKPS